MTGIETTLNTAEHWNSAGQFLIMLLIEIGGLGFMMVPIYALVWIKKKSVSSTRIILKEAPNLEEVSRCDEAQRDILKLAFVDRN